jgi:hypothetical protein
MEMKETYPCKECIVKPVCSDVCRKLPYQKKQMTIFTHSEDEQMSTVELFDFLVEKKHCPDCGSNEILSPPSWNPDHIYQIIVCNECNSGFEIDLFEGGNEFHAHRRSYKARKWFNRTDYDEHIKMAFESFIDDVLIPRIQEWKGCEDNY